MTHNQEEALTMSDRIAVMRNGRFEQIGAKTEIYTNPASAFVASFVGHANRLNTTIQHVDDALAGIDWGGRRILVPRPVGTEAGSNVSYFVKHEDMEIAAANDTAVNPRERNSLPGQLRDVIFKGQTASYIVVLPNGEDIMVSGTPRSMLARPSDRVVVSWPVAAGACFADVA